MKEENLIKEVKKSNGNNIYSNKDLLFYIVGRVDKLDDKLDEAIKLLNIRINKKLDTKTFTTVIITLVTVLVTGIGGMFRFIYSLLK